MLTREPALTGTDSKPFSQWAMSPLCWHSSGPVYGLSLWFLYHISLFPHPPQTPIHGPECSLQSLDMPWTSQGELGERL